MYIAGLVQGSMWNQFDETGNLVYQNFLETVTQIVPMYLFRGIGGLLYFVGVIMMLVNIIKTVKAGSFVAEEKAEAPALVRKTGGRSGYWHRWIEKRPIQMLIISLLLLLVGSLIELIPTFMIKENVPTIEAVKPYTALELEGRDIYIKEGCYVCHSQLIRPFRSETERYGEYSKAGEYVYDRPFQWGSKRTGPDLLRVGGKYPDSWHFYHMIDPKTMSPKSIMPPYPHMRKKKVNKKMTQAKINTMRKLGVPYADDYDANAERDKQANMIVENLKAEKIKVDPDAEIVALIAYLQRLGTDIKNAGKEELPVEEAAETVVAPADSANTDTVSTENISMR